MVDEPIENLDVAAVDAQSPGETTTVLTHQPSGPELIEKRKRGRPRKVPLPAAATLPQPPPLLTAGVALVPPVAATVVVPPPVAAVAVDAAPVSSLLRRRG